MTTANSGLKFVIASVLSAMPKFILTMHLMRDNPESFKEISSLEPSTLGRILATGLAYGDERGTSICDVWPESWENPYPSVSGIYLLRQFAGMVIIARIWDLLLEGLRK